MTAIICLASGREIRVKADPGDVEKRLRESGEYVILNGRGEDNFPANVDRYTTFVTFEQDDGRREVRVCPLLVEAILDDPPRGF